MADTADSRPARHAGPMAARTAVAMASPSTRTTTGTDSWNAVGSPNARAALATVG